jgi:uncharacterized protein (UPF0548 family)
MTVSDDWHDGSVPGFRSYESTTFLGADPGRWTFASRAVLEWGVKTRSGFTVEAADGSSGTGTQVSVGNRCWLVAHLGPISIREPVEVVGVIDEPHRKGFAYGTLAGHPLSGEDSFVVELRTDGSVWLTIRSVARSSPGPWRVVRPALAFAQTAYRRRYMRSLAGDLHARPGSGRAAP